MGDVIEMRPPLPEVGFLVCPECQAEDGFFFPVCRPEDDQPVIAALVCSTCETEIPVSNGFLMPPESREGA